MTSGERLRQEGRDEMRDQMRAVAERRHREGRSEGHREGRLETIDGFLRAGVDWSMIERATGLGEQEYRKLKRQPNGAPAAGGDGTLDDTPDEIGHPPPFHQERPAWLRGRGAQDRLSRTGWACGVARRGAGWPGDQFGCRDLRALS